MSNYELVKYEECPSDQYVKALCTILIDGKYCVSYVKKTTKDGNTFWSAMSMGIQDGEKKRYHDAFFMDSMSANEKLLDFVRGCEKAREAKPTSMDEVANAQAMPF